MLFATDNAAGDRIMADLYASAAKTILAMRQEARDRQRGKITLGFEDPGLVTTTYEYEPPWTPRDDDRGGSNGSSSPRSP